MLAEGARKVPTITSLLTVAGVATVASNAPAPRMLSTLREPAPARTTSPERVTPMSPRTSPAGMVTSTGGPASSRAWSPGQSPGHAPPLQLQLVGSIQFVGSTPLPVQPHVSCPIAAIAVPASNAAQIVVAGDRTTETLSRGRHPRRCCRRPDCGRRRWNSMSPRCPSPRRTRRSWRWPGCRWSSALRRSCSGG